jgi:hypothetical protein
MAWRKSIRNWKGGVRLDQVRRLSHPQSLLAAVSASLLAAVLSREIAAGLDALLATNEAQAAAMAAFPPRAPTARTATTCMLTARVA